MGISKYIAAAALSASSIWVQASDTFQAQVIEQTEPLVSKVCGEYNRKSGEILKWDQSCEYSTDNGKTWIKVIGWASILTLSLGALVRIRKRKIEKEKIADAELDNSDFLDGPAAEFQKISLTEETIVPDDEWLDNKNYTIDPLSEADVYMAYGRHGDAETILLNAIKKDPEKIETYIKLLEVYYKTKKSQKFKDTYILLMGPQFDWKIKEEEIHQIKKWSKEIDSENSLYETPENHRDAFSIGTTVAAKIPKNLWDTIPLLTERVQKRINTNEIIKITEEEKLKIIERLRWVPMNPKMIDPGEFKKFEMKRINEAVMNQLIQRWFSIIEDEESWVVLIQPIKQWSSLYYLDKWNIGIISTNESYVINPQTRNATMDFIDTIPCIKLTLPRGEVEYIQINGVRIPILHKK